jgi:protein SCO1
MAKSRGNSIRMKNDELCSSFSIHIFAPRIKKVSKKAVIALCLAILLPVVSYFIVKGVSSDAIIMPRHYFPEFTTDTIIEGKRVSDTTWHQLQNITLVNQLGDTVSLDSLRGKIVVADFFFTRCPTICPYLTRNMQHLQNALKLNDLKRPVDSAFVHFVSFSVDPERDSVEVLRRYATRFGVNDDLWWLLTGPKKTIYDFALHEIKLGLQDGEGIDSNFVHSSKFVLIDKKGVVRGFYNGLDTAKLSELSRDIGLLQLEKDRSKPSEIFRQLKALWPVYIAVIASVIIFVWITRRSRLQPK